MNFEFAQFWKEFLNTNFYSDKVGLISFGYTALIATLGTVASALSWSSANKAKVAAESIKLQISLINSISNVGETISEIEKLKMLQREKKWERVPELCTSLKRKLVILRSENKFEERQNSSIQETIATLAQIEHQVEKALQNKSTDKLEQSKFNKSLSDCNDKLTEIGQQLKKVGI